MRKQDPASIRQDLEAALRDVITATDEVLKGTRENGRPFLKATTKLTAESALLRAAILWEGFVSDIVVAYVNRDSSGYAEFVRQRLLAEAQGRYGADLVSAVTVAFPSHLKVARVRKLLDDKGYNVTFKSSDDLIGQTQKWLATADSQKFSALTAAQRASLDACQALRNFLAHRSPSSKKRMANALAKGDLPQGLGRGANSVHDVGAFLLATPVGIDHRRLHLYLEAVRGCAATVCP